MKNCSLKNLFIFLFLVFFITACAPKIQINGIEGEVPDHVKIIKNPETGIEAIYFAYYTKDVLIDEEYLLETKYLGTNAEENILPPDTKEVVFSFKLANPNKTFFKVYWITEIDYLKDKEFPFIYSHCVYEGKLPEKNISMKLPMDEASSIKFTYEIRDENDAVILSLGNLKYTYRKMSGHE